MHLGVQRTVRDLEMVLNPFHRQNAVLVLYGAVREPREKRALFEAPSPSDQPHSGS